MRIAVVAGGWHYPFHFYQKMAEQDYPTKDVELFVVAHRSPELPIVRDEKVADLENAPGQLGAIDRIMYRETVTIKKLKDLDWNYLEAPNLAGDQVFLNQWLERYDYRQYDAILNCHDDTFIRRNDLFRHVASIKDYWLVIANGKNSAESDGYFRGSFEFWHQDMIAEFDGKIDVGVIPMTREGKTDTPKERETLQVWNQIGVPVRKFIEANEMTQFIQRLSPYYRVSPWVIEGERGFLHRQAFAPEWRMDEGLKAYPL